MSYKSKYDDSYNRYLNGGYNNTSSAVVLDPAPPEEDYGYRKPTVRKDRRKETARDNKRRQAQEKPVSVNIAPKNHSRVFRLATFSVVLLGAFLCVFSMAYIESRRLELENLQGELEQIKIDNIILRDQVIANYDLPAIYDYAQNVLGMTNPEDSQVVYVDEVKVSFSERYKTPAQEKSPFGVLNDLMASFQGDSKGGAGSEGE